MNLEDISNIYKENLDSFFRNEKVIELIYKEQFGSENYEENKKQYHEKYNEIMNNTVFMPYITLEDLDNMLINARASYVSIYLQAYSNKEKKLKEKIETNRKNIIKENSSSLLNDLKQFFPNLTEDEYLNISKHCSDTDFDKNTKFIEDTLLKDTKGIVSKFKKEKIEKIIENYKQMTSQKILEEDANIIENAQQLYGSEYMESHYSKELDLSKRLNIEKKNIIKKYSSFMLDDLKQLFPGLTKDEYSKILKDCSNESFDKNAIFIENELFEKDKNRFFKKIKKTKVEKIIEKYRKLTDEKVLMETSSFYKHLSDVPKGKYYTDIFEKISNGGQYAIQSIGKSTEKNIRYIFLPVFKYQSKEAYLKNALHEVMHISKEQLSNGYYRSGFFKRELSKNSNDSALKIRPNYLSGIFPTLKWSRIAKQNNLPKRSGLYTNVQRNNCYRRSITSLASS